MSFHVPGPLYSFILLIDSGYMTLNFPGGSDVKNLPAMQETRLDPWVGKIPLEKRMATDSNILVWRIPWTEEPDGLQSMGSQRQTRLSD